MRPRPSWMAALLVLGLAVARAWAQSVEEGFVPEEAKINVSCDPDAGGVRWTQDLITFGPATGAILLILAAVLLLRGTPYSARFFGWLGLVFGLVPAVILLMDAAVLPTPWVEGEGIGVAVTVVTVLGGIAVILSSDRRLRELRRGNLRSETAPSTEPAERVSAP